MSRISLVGYRAAEVQYRALAAGTRPDQVREAKAAVRAARADVAAARVRLDEAVVRAPADGVVTAMDLHAGDLVATGALTLPSVLLSGFFFERSLMPPVIQWLGYLIPLVGNIARHHLARRSLRDLVQPVIAMLALGSFVLLAASLRFTRGNRA